MHGYQPKHHFHSMGGIAIKSPSIYPATQPIRLEKGEHILGEFFTFYFIFTMYFGGGLDSLICSSRASTAWKTHRGCVHYSLLSQCLQPNCNEDLYFGLPFLKSCKQSNGTRQLFSLQILQDVVFCPLAKPVISVIGLYYFIELE